MAQYKVLQDIEAEDKLLGPLSLRQFIYAAITIATGFIAVRLFMTSVWFVGIIFVPPTLFFGLLAAPLGGQQSSEIWLLAKIRFFLKPKRRIWDQTGLQELVTITAPKQIERHLTDGYSQDEIKSRLRTLATTLDTRGWAVKNATTNMYVQQDSSSDRLLDISATNAPTVYVEPGVDMLDTQANPRAQAMDQMMTQASQKHRDTIMKNVQQAQTAQAKATQDTEQTSKEEQALLDQIHRVQSQPSPSQGHMKVVQPAHDDKPTKQGSHTVTQAPDPAILNIVENSDDLSVQTIAKQANRAKEKGDDDEVVISLH